MPERNVKDILDAWRELERRQAQLDPHDADHAALEAEIALLRDEYQRATTEPVLVKPSGRDSAPSA